MLTDNASDYDQMNKYVRKPKQTFDWVIRHFVEFQLFMFSKLKIQVSE